MIAGCIEQMVAKYAKKDASREIYMKRLYVERVAINIVHSS